MAASCRFCPRADSVALSAVFGGKQEAQPNVAAVVDWLGDNAQAGDLLLIGGNDWVSRSIQRITDSPYSHVSVVMGPDSMIEAYDYDFTVSEDDEGVYETSFTDFAKRHNELAEIALYRLPGASLDLDRLRYAAALLRRSAPTYPTLAAAMFLVGQLSGRLTRFADRRRWLTPSPQRMRKQAQFWGDGPTRVHCAELATRLYCASGASLEFHEPFMGPYIDTVNGAGNYRADDLQDLETGDELVTEKELSKRGTVAQGFVPLARVSSLFNAIVNRALSEAEPDIADYIVPDDFTKAAPFQQVNSLIVHSRAV